MLNHIIAGDAYCILVNFGIQKTYSKLKSKIMRRVISIAILIFLSVPFYLSAQTEKVDLEMIYKIKQEGFKNSGIEELSFWMTDYVGPRLTASNGKKRADEWSSNRMKEYGLVNVKIEEARPFSRGGWENQKAYMSMTVPYYVNFSVNPKAWTGSTNGLIEGEPVLLNILTLEDFDQYRGKLKDKIVIMPVGSTYEVSFDALASRYTDEELEEIKEARITTRRRRGNYSNEFRQVQRQAATFLVEEGVAAVVNGSGVFNVPRSNGANYVAGEQEPIAEVNLPVEAHGRIVRLLEHDVDVTLEMEINNKFYESPSVTNVIGEIQGTDPRLKDQVVLIGGHLDSWHGGTGAADNASGCIVMMEAMRILKALNVEPRRTIRVALWGGEEQGLHGSRGYVEQYIRDPETGKFKKGFENFAVYFNMDNGTGKFRGIYTQENEMIAPIFEEWLKPFENMGSSTVTTRTTSGTDHLSFDALGLPAFQFIQDEIEYGRGYHTTMDTYERLLMDDLKHNAVVIAAMVYQAAMRDELLPRKPVIESLSNQDRRRF